MKQLLRIGELARLGGVSVKALRFYDEQGLLRPSHVDPHTGYRYYELEQAKRLAVITNLRIVDFSIAEIAALLAEDDLDAADYKQAIRTKQRDLAREQRELSDKIKIAEMLAETASENAASFKLAAIDDQRVYALRRSVPQLGAPVTEMFEAAEAAVAKSNARAPAAPFLIFHDPPTTKADISLEVCIPVTEEGEDLPAAKTISGSALSCAVVYGGGYFKTEQFFDQMTAWIASAGLKATGPLREIYHRFGADQDDYRLPAKMIAKHRSEFLTELQIPISLTLPHMETS